MAQVAEIKTAFEAAKRINLSALELEELEKRQMYAMQEEANLEWARQEALEEGIGIGREKGGQAKEHQIVQHMLGLRMSPEQIAELTAVPLANILQIQQEVNNGRS